MNVFLYIQCSCVRSEEKFFLEPVSVDPRLQWEESGASDCCEKCWGGPRCLRPALTKLDKISPLSCGSTGLLALLAQVHYTHHSASIARALLNIVSILCCPTQVVSSVPKTTSNSTSKKLHQPSKILSFKNYFTTKANNIFFCRNEIYEQNKIMNDFKLSSKIIILQQVCLSRKSWL